MAQTGNIWATHILYLNDEQEYRYAFSLASRFLQNGLLPPVAAAYPSLLEPLRQRVSGLSVQRYLPSVYVASFSEKWDDLNQWRAYTQPGDGYRVAFSKTALQKRANSEGWRLEKCLYGSQNATLLTPLIGDIFDEYAAGAWADAKDRASAAAEEFVRRLLLVAPIMKHEAFADEAEWRLISPAVNDLARSPLDDGSNPVHYRKGASFVTRYLRFDFRKGEDHSIIDMLVGPGPNPTLAEETMGSIVVTHGFRCGWGLSVVPYRPW